MRNGEAPMGWVKFEKALPRTLKLFHRDPYATRCEATVLWTRDSSVVTDRSVFYAESGGQDFDTGTIDGVPVIDVQDQFVIPCGGTHVARADELEPLRVRRSKKGKRVTRLTCRFESELE